MDSPWIAHHKLLSRNLDFICKNCFIIPEGLRFLATRSTDDSIYEPTPLHLCSQNPPISRPTSMPGGILILIHVWIDFSKILIQCWAPRWSRFGAGLVDIMSAHGTRLDPSEFPRPTPETSRLPLDPLQPPPRPPGCKAGRPAQVAGGGPSKLGR